MIASVFFMQPLGQIAGNVVTLVVGAASQSQGDENLRYTVDVMWRWVIGLGVIPGVLAVAFRFAIPETPRYVLEIEDDPIKAEFDTTPMFGENDSAELECATWGSTASAATNSVGEVILPAPAIHESGQWTIAGAPPVTLNSQWKLSRKDIVQYFWHEGNWKTLFGTASTWLLLDFSFYGIGLSSPQFLAKTWGSLRLSEKAPPWQTNDSGDVSIYAQLMATSVHALVILNVGSLTGMILMIIFSNRVNRVTLQKVGFLLLAVIFTVLGTIFITVHKSGGPAIIALYIIAQTAFNFGPNATTYMIPAEAFPTRYRASCHGISAASGKLGSILVQVFSAYYRFGSSGTSRESTKRYGTIIIVFAAVMVVGAIVTHYMIPDMQEKREKGAGWRTVGRNKTLEELALGRRGEESQSVIRARRTRNGG
jgi:MFS transporter, PHS family, inorganic phosphate transporter